MAYRVEFCDLLTDRMIYPSGDVDGLQFGRRISEPETISGTLTVTAGNAERLRDLLPGRTAVYVYDGQDLMVGGVLWDVKPSWAKPATETLAFSGSTFESYWNQVVISTDIAPATSVDQLDIARTLVMELQADPSADLRVLYDPLTSGVLRDRTQYLATANKSYGEALSELGKVENGFEWTIDVYPNPAGGRIKRLRFGYPRLGSASAVHVLEGVLESRTETTVSTGTRYRARGGTPQGAGTTDQQPLLSTVHAADDLLATGWPRIDVVTDYSTVTEPSTLESHAARDLAAARAVRAIPQVTVSLADTRLTPAAIGETVRIRHRTLLTGMTDVMYRLIGIQVTAGQRGAAASAVLTLEAL